VPGRVSIGGVAVHRCDSRRSVIAATSAGLMFKNGSVIAGRLPLLEVHGLVSG
jgi:hypothetical protein